MNINVVSDEIVSTINDLFGITIKSFINPIEDITSPSLVLTSDQYDILMSNKSPYAVEVTWIANVSLPAFGLPRGDLSTFYKALVLRLNNLDDGGVGVNHLYDRVEKGNREFSFEIKLL